MRLGSRKEGRKCDACGPFDIIKSHPCFLPFHFNLPTNPPHPPPPQKPKHENRYHDAWVDAGDGHLYLQLEWCEGGSLEDLIFGPHHAAAQQQQQAPPQPPPRPPRRQQPPRMRGLVEGQHGHPPSASSDFGPVVPSGGRNPFLCPSPGLAAAVGVEPEEEGQGEGQEEQWAWGGTEAELLTVLRDAALALHHMHRRGIAHMDVKVRVGGCVCLGGWVWMDGAHMPPSSPSRSPHTAQLNIRSPSSSDTDLTHTPPPLSPPQITPTLPNSSPKSPPSQFPHSTQPSNLLLAGCGSWKLGDLGHALKVDGSMPLVEEGDARYLDRCVLV